MSALPPMFAAMCAIPSLLFGSLTTYGRAVLDVIEAYHATNNDDREWTNKDFWSHWNVHRTFGNCSHSSNTGKATHGLSNLVTLDLIELTRTEGRKKFYRLTSRGKLMTISMRHETNDDDSNDDPIVNFDSSDDDDDDDDDDDNDRKCDVFEQEFGPDLQHLCFDDMAASDNDEEEAAAIKESVDDLCCNVVEEVIDEMRHVPAEVKRLLSPQQLYRLYLHRLERMRRRADVMMAALNARVDNGRKRKYPRREPSQKMEDRWCGKCQLPTPIQGRDLEWTCRHCAAVFQRTDYSQPAPDEHNPMLDCAGATADPEDDDKDGDSHNKKKARMKEQPVSRMVRNLLR